MKPANLLFLMADEHRRDAMGCAGHPMVKTPNMDALAARGTRFTDAYTNCPICVPSRAAFATGDYAHKTRCWDNANAWDGSVRGWGHVLQDAKIPVQSIGKLHYRAETDPLGFDEKHIAMYIKDGVGSVTGAVRDPLPPLKPDARTKLGFAAKAGPGLSTYNQYDIKVAELASDWLKGEIAGNREQPWMLFVSFLAPHYPLTVPQEFLDLYDPDKIDLPVSDPESTGYQRHPWADVLAAYQPHGNGMTPERIRMAIAAYYALCSFVDYRIGLVLTALEEAGLTGSTRIIYTSDHGENAGERGMWGKSVLYEHSTGVPMIMAGPDIAAGEICTTPVSLVDCRQTILDGVGAADDAPDGSLPGRSLFDIAAAPDDAGRTIFSEYHAAYSPSGGFMLRQGKWKYHYYVGYDPELFDLDADPGELTNLADDPACAEIRAALHAELLSIVDPEAADRQAKDDQNALLDRFGGREKVLADDIGGGTSFTRVPDTVAKDL